MSEYRMSGESGRLFPGGIENELHKLPMRVFGVLLVVLSVIGWLSLLTWSIGDPSLNRAANGAPSNLLGTIGASLADVLLQLFGLGAIGLFLPPAAWGLSMATGVPARGMRQRLLMWALALVLIASTLSILPQPRGWVLTHGLGGVIGDFGQSFFVRIGGFLNPNFAGIIGAVIAGYVGLWALVRACGIGLSDLGLLWRLPPRGSPSRAAVTSGVGYLFGRGIHLKDQIARVVVRDRRRVHLQETDWRAQPPAAPPPPPRQQPRSAEASYDPRFSGYEMEPEVAAPAPPPPPRRTSPRPAATEPRPAPEASGAGPRIEPFFDTLPSYPAPEPGHRPVRVLPTPALRPIHPSEQRRRPPLQPYAAETGYAPPQYEWERRPVQPQQQQQQHQQHQHQPQAQQQHYYDAAERGAAHQPYIAPQYQDQEDDEDDLTGSEHGYDDDPRGHRDAYRANGYAGERADHYDEARQADRYAAQPRERYVEERRETRPPAPAAPPPQRNGHHSRRTLIVPPVDDEPRYADFKVPSLRLLTMAPERRGNPELSDTALGRKAELLHGVLEDFGIKGSITGVHPGPVITLFELEPARGTKSSRVIGLADDIARSMSAVSARVAVIPGRDAIGIELPNVNRETVYLRELLESADFAKGKAALPLALGKTIAGAPVTVDLARMPHLLIAGTTGSGKSVAINAMILSLLYRLTPEQCRFILIDPKMLELSVYDDIPHLLTPVVTDPRKAIAALKWTVGEMNVRYERMCKLGVRNITGFNQKVSRAKMQGRPLTRTVQTGFDEDGEAIYEREEIDDSPMPYIVVVIDEMADLMMVAGKDIEYAVQRLSQMARAAGIHLIMATQRPSVDVITGTIKANFPSRVSFQVTSKIDSRTILGEQGAEQLLGAGDMLSMAAGGRIMRGHGPFVSDEEVERVVAYLKEQAEPDYLEGLLDDDAPIDPKRSAGGDPSGREPSGEEVYDQAVAIVLKERRATTSYLQRRLGIGYNRAASLIERMEQEGLISPPNRTGKREIRGGEGE